MKTIFTNTDNSTTVEFEYLNCIRETQYLPSGEVVVNEISPFQAAAKGADLIEQGYSVSEE